MTHFSILRPGGILVSEIFVLIVASAQQDSTPRQKYTGTLFEHKVIKSKVTLEKSKSPYLVANDVLVLPEGEVNVEPGVTIKFAPEVGFTVRGIFNADGGNSPKDIIR